MKTRTLVLIETVPASRMTVFPDTPKGMVRAKRLLNKLSKGVKSDLPELTRYPVRWASNTKQVMARSSRRTHRTRSAR